MDRVGKIVGRSPEEVWVSLQEVHGRPHLELRVYQTPPGGDAAPLPGREPVLLPIEQLPHLLRVLTRAEELCVSRGFLNDSRPPAAVVMERGNVLAIPLATRAAEARREPRVPVHTRAECRLVNPDRFWPTKPLAGEMRDLSKGGGQVWLPQRLPRFKQVDVALVIDGRGFQGRAEIVSVELETKRDPQTGYHRHGLRWIAVEPKAMEILSGALAKRMAGNGR